MLRSIRSGIKTRSDTRENQRTIRSLERASHTEVPIIKGYKSYIE